MGIYVEPASVESTYGDVVVSEPQIIELNVTANSTDNSTGEFYFIDLDDYLDFPVDDDEIDDRYTITVSCVDELNSTDSLCDDFNVSYAGIYNGTLILFTSEDLDPDETYTFDVIISDDEFDLEDVTLTISLVVKLQCEIEIVSVFWLGRET